MRIFSLFFIAVVSLLTACDRYQVSVNDRVVHTPATKLPNAPVPDPALKTCIIQTMQEQNIMDITQLQRLDCSYAGITSLAQIGLFTGLQQVNFSNNQIHDGSPLLFLTELQFANLKDNQNMQCETLTNLRKNSTVKLLLPQNCVN